MTLWYTVLWVGGPRISLRLYKSYNHVGGPSDDSWPFLGCIGIEKLFLFKILRALR